jgi:hypothetical protein
MSAGLKNLGLQQESGCRTCSPGSGDKSPALYSSLTEELNIYGRNPGNVAVLASVCAARLRIFVPCSILSCCPMSQVDAHNAAAYFGNVSVKRTNLVQEWGG